MTQRLVGAVLDLLMRASAALWFADRHFNCRLNEGRPERGGWAALITTQAGIRTSICVAAARHLYVGLFPSLLVLLLPAVSAQAQNTNDVNAGIQFDFSAAGARSLGIGGAFVALADDATASYGNPAGLVALGRPEVSGELRHWQWRSTIPSIGHAYGPASGIGVDTVNGLVDATFMGSRIGPSFGSFVLPFRSWKFAAFHRVLTRYKLARSTGSEFFACTGGFRGELPLKPPFCEPDAKQDGINRFNAEQETMDLEIQSTGGAVAYQLRKKLSVGFGLQFATFQMTSTNNVFGNSGSLKFAPLNLAPSNIELVLTQNGDDTAWAFNSGLLWTVNDSVTIGGAFQQGPKFAFSALTLTGPAHARGADAIVADVPANPFKVPDRYAIGMVFRTNKGNPQKVWKLPEGFWLLCIEFDRVNYSQLVGDNYRTTTVTPTDPEGTVFAQGFRLDDSNQLRGGLEYTTDLSKKREWIVSFRTGLFYDPQHSPYYQPTDAATGFPNPRAALGFPKGSDEVHGSAGLGIVVGHLQVDFAADFARTGNTVALSTVYRF